MSEQEIAQAASLPTRFVLSGQYYVCIHSYNGRDYISLADENTANSYRKRLQPQLGERKFTEISKEEFDLGLDAIIAIITGAASKSPASTPADGPAILNKSPEEKLALINRLIAIIKSSNQEGEVANSKTLFKKITGKDFDLATS